MNFDSNFNEIEETFNSKNITEVSFENSLSNNLILEQIYYEVSLFNFELIYLNFFNFFS